MRFREIGVVLALVAAVCVDAVARGVRVWEHPTVEVNELCHGGYFFPLLEVSRVELSADETVVHFHAAYRPEFDFNFTDDSYLLIDSVRYDAINPRNINTVQEGMDFSLRFPALPAGTDKFDFVNGRDFRLTGITDGSARRGTLVPSNWRDDKTGDWLIGLFDDCVIYDARFWNYVGVRPDEKAKSFEITDGSLTLKVEVGKQKDGRRKFMIDDKRFECSAITGRTLPPYPMKDNRKLRDTRYASGDSVELVVWMKDMPEWLRERAKVYDITVHDITNGEEKHTATPDSLGRFAIKFPMDNTALIYADWRRSFMRNVFEPGERYFLLYDYKTGQTLFMGPDSRLQNELMMYAPRWRCASAFEYNGRKFSDLFHAADSINNVLNNELDSVCRRYPTLSDRFRDVHLANQRVTSLGSNLGIAGIPDSTVAYVMENCMPYAGPPYSLVREAPRFITSFMKTVNRGWEKTFDEEKYEHEVKYTPEERVVLDQCDSVGTAFKQVYDTITDASKKEAYRMDYLKSNQLLLIKGIQVLNGESRNRVMYPRRFVHEIPHGVAVIDSLGLNGDVKDVWILGKVFELFDRTHSSLPAEVIEMTQKYVTNPHILDKVMKENDKYVRIEQKASQPAQMADTSVLKDLTEGEKLLEAIIAPHKGKFVLIDFWGTWCAPCKRALSHSGELYERLKDYDIVYIYLANNSAENTWRNIIEEYNVKGDNVLHYNLPAEKQAEIEKMLKVTAFPSYRLVDRDGEVLDIEIDPQTYGSLESLLKKLSGK